MMMEAPSLNEFAPAADPLKVGDRVQTNDGIGKIVEAFRSPGGGWWYEVAVDGVAVNVTHWHDEIAPLPIDAALMAEAAGPAIDAIEATVGELVADPAKILAPPAADAAIDAGFRSLLDQASAIIAKIDAPKPGDLVVLKCGGPQMIVERIEGDGLLVCWWMDHGANLHVARFPVPLVEIVPNHAEMRA